jgi:glycosyltransferase involved in cell wall biosynthesis
MRVGLVVYGSIETLTGGYLYDRRLLDHLVSQGDRVEVISLPSRNHYPRALCDNASPSLIRRLTRARFDVLLQDELVHPSLVFLNGWLRARARYPIVTIVHLLRSSEETATRLRGWYSAAERRYLATVDAALYNSETTRRAVEALLGRGLPGVIAYPGGDHLAVERSETELAAQARASGPLCILSIANVLPGKGLSVLIDALSQLPAESWRLQIVGNLTMDRPYVDHLRGLIARAGLATHVCLVGMVPNRRIPEYLIRSHLLVVPSHYEALGIAYLEAMRFGLPVIATTAGGAHEIVEHGREGFLVPPGDTDALTWHLRLFCADRELLLRMGLAARRRAARHPTWGQSFERARIFLGSVVDAHRRAKSGETMP